MIHNPSTLIVRQQAGTPLGLVNVNVTPVGNILTGEDTLMSYTLPANTLATNGRGVRITIGGTVSATANVKTVKLYFGATILWQLAPGIAAAGAWSANGTLLRTGASTQKGSFFGTNGPQTGGSITQSDLHADAGPVEDLTTGVVIKVTGEATATDDIIQTFMLIEVF